MPEGRAPIDYASPVAHANRERNVWATIGCVLAIGFLIPPVALAGAIAGWVGLRRSADPNVGGKRAARIGLWFGLMGVVLTPVEGVGVWWAMGKRDEIMCQSQISTIAQCVFMYANNNHDQLPPDLSTAVVEEGLPLNDPILFCPASSATSAPSYVYLRAAQRVANVKNPAATVMFYEPPNHFGGMNVAFYDGHVELVPRRKASNVIAELKAGQNPPPSLTTP